MPPVRFEPTIAAGERPYTYALDRAATGIGFITRLANIMEKDFILSEVRTGVLHLDHALYPVGQTSVVFSVF